METWRCTRARVVSEIAVDARLLLRFMRNFLRDTSWPKKLPNYTSSPAIRFTFISWWSRPSSFSSTVVVHGQTPKRDLKQLCKSPVFVAYNGKTLTFFPFKKRISGYPLITYYWTGLLILDHSFLVGNLTNSKFAETKALEPLKPWHLCISNFGTC